jgi:poly(3-hydroxybutyrate) depolymerase
VNPARRRAVAAAVGALTNTAVALLLLAPIASQAGAQMPPVEPGVMADGSGEFRVTPAANPAITVFFHRPAGAGRDARVVIALHGLLRQGAVVREAWRTLAEQHGFIVVVPQFDATGYRGSLNYNTGRVMVDGQATPPASWSFAVIEEVFDAVRAR